MTQTGAEEVGGREEEGQKAGGHTGCQRRLVVSETSVLVAPA